MPSSMSSSSSETEFRRPSVPDRAEVQWRSIENATKDKLYQLDLDPVSLPDSQKSFRTKFEDLWRTNSIPNVQTLLCRVDASFYQTAAFINAINGATSKINGDGVASFLWGICFAIFHSVLLRGSSHKSVDQLVGDNGLVQIVVDLNNALAIVDVTLGVSGMYKFEDRLHGIYKKYVECCLGVIAICARRTDVIAGISGLESPRDCVADAIRRITEEGEALKSWECSARAVVDDEEESDTIHAYQAPQEYHMPGSWPTFPERGGQGLFREIKLLGHGGFGDVWHVKHELTGEEFARKVLQKQRNTKWPSFKKEVLKEYANVVGLDHKHIVTAHNCVENSDTMTMEIYFTPVAEGNLLQILRKGASIGYPDELVKKIYSWFGCLLEALDHCHQETTIHKDIKPQNILVNDGTVYLNDFGLSRNFWGEDSQTNSNFAGTNEYQAPEYSWGDYHGRAGDVFSLGCVFSEMFTAAKRADLTEFKRRRLVHQSNRDDSQDRKPVYCFHRTLHEVKAWLKQIASPGNEDDDVLLEVMEGMLDVRKNERFPVKECLAKIRGREALRCRCRSSRRDSVRSTGSLRPKGFMEMEPN